MTKEESRILELEFTLKEVRRMFDEILWDDKAREQYQKIDKEYKESNDV